MLRLCWLHNVINVTCFIPAILIQVLEPVRKEQLRLSVQRFYSRFVKPFHAATKRLEQLLTRSCSQISGFRKLRIQESARFPTQSMGQDPDLCESTSSFLLSPFLLRGDLWHRLDQLCFDLIYRQPHINYPFL